MGRKKSPTSEMQPSKQAKTPLAQRLKSLITDANELKDYLGCSIQAVNQFICGASRPSLDNLCKIADFYGVSTDYLLGRTDEPSPEYDIQTACLTTGLSGHSTKLLSQLNESTAYTREFRQSVIDHILKSEIFWTQTIKHLQSAWQIRLGTSSLTNPHDNEEAEILAAKLTTLNLGGYTKYIVMDGESASKLQIQYAADSMKELFRLIIEDILEKDSDDNGKHKKGN